MTGGLCDRPRKGEKGEKSEMKGGIREKEEMSMEVVKSRRHLTGQNTDVIQEPLDEVLVLMGLLIDGHLALATDFGRRDFDLEFMLKLAFCGLIADIVSQGASGAGEYRGENGTYIRFGHLGEIDLVGEMAVAHPVFVAIPSATSRRIDHSELAHVAVVVHFEVDADAPVDACLRAVDVQVGDAAFDNLGEDLVGSLVHGHADLGLVARVQVLSDHWRQFIRGYLIESVALFLVGI